MVYCNILFLWKIVDFGYFFIFWPLYRKWKTGNQFPVYRYMDKCLLYQMQEKNNTFLLPTVLENRSDCVLVEIRNLKKIDLFQKSRALSDLWWSNDSTSFPNKDRLKILHRLIVKTQKFMLQWFTPRRALRALYSIFGIFTPNV